MKFIRNTLIIDAMQINAAEAGDYGNLGTLSSGDYIVTLADGTITSASEATITCNFTETSSSSSVTGSAWLFP